jgi:hypothetical protein
LGKDISFVQALVQLKVMKTISIGGFYAQRWPEYQEEKMGLKPLNGQNIPGSTWPRMLKSYQKGTDIRPWIDHGEDVGGYGSIAWFESMFDLVVKLAKTILLFQLSGNINNF